MRPPADAPASWLDRAVQRALRVAYAVMRAWWWVARPTLRGALVGVWLGDSLLLIRNSYRAGETLPSGGVHPGETPREGACRELREEVGIDVPEGRLVFVGEFDVWCEGKRDVDYVFELHLETPPELRVDRREVVAAHFVARHELPGRQIREPARIYLESIGVLRTSF